MTCIPFSHQVCLILDIIISSFCTSLKGKGGQSKIENSLKAME